MGASPEDTRREIDRLRSDLTAAVDEVERRVRGGIKAVTPDETPGPLREEARPTLLGVAGVVVVSAVGYGVYTGIRRWQESRTPRGRVEKRLREARHGLEERVEEARKRAILVKLEPTDSGFSRIVDARLEPPQDKYKGLKDMLKKADLGGVGGGLHGGRERDRPSNRGHSVARHRA